MRTDTCGNKIRKSVLCEDDKRDRYIQRGQRVKPDPEKKGTQGSAIKDNKRICTDLSVPSDSSKKGSERSKGLEHIKEKRIRLQKSGFLYSATGGAS